VRFLRTNTAVIVTVGPFYDKTDGVTIEGALTITNERITLTADTDAGSAPTLILDNITGATAATANDLNYITNTDAGLMQLELAAADTNRLGRMFLTITDAANHVPVFHEFMVLPAMIYDAFILGTDVLDASVTQWLGTAAATPTVAGVPEVDLTHVAGATTNVSALATNVDAILTDTAVIGTTGQGLTSLATQASVTTIDDFLDTEVAAILAAVDTEVAAILADTNELQTDWVDGGRLDLILDARASQTSVNTVDDFLDTEVAAILAAVDTEVATIVTAVGTTIPALLGTPAGASISADIAAIEAQTDDIGAAGAGLTALATQASVNTIDDFLDTEIAAIVTAVVTDIPALIAALNNLSAAAVNAEIVDALNVDTYAQPGQGTPAATTTIRLMLAYLYKAYRNRHTQTASEYDLYNDDAVTVDQKAAVSDDAVTFDRGEVATGP